MLRQELEAFIKEHEEEALHLLLTLARIPAPSNHEEKRAEFCKKWLVEQGAEGVYIDEALNVIYPVDVKPQGPVEVFMAHTDVVFADETELPLSVQNGRIYCPGVGDDTACLVCILLAAKYIASIIGTGLWKELRGENAPGILLVCNSGEEGLGNLKGVRAVCEAFKGRITGFCTFDSCLEKMVDRAVGSLRYRITVRTEGGHSFGDFGRDNAIQKLSALVCELYGIQVPTEGRTTYNVGLISGGTSVNTIAQEAWMLYEFRSDRRENLAYMEEQLKGILNRAREQGLKVSCEEIGRRPCEGEVDEVKKEVWLRRGIRAVKDVLGTEPERGMGSTDCNIPLSLGIPSICLGSFRGAGAHTREEYVEIDSLGAGYRVAFGMIFGEAAYL